MEVRAAPAEAVGGAHIAAAGPNGRNGNGLEREASDGPQSLLLLLDFLLQGLEGFPPHSQLPLHLGKSLPHIGYIRLHIGAALAVMGAVPAVAILSLPRRRHAGLTPQLLLQGRELVHLILQSIGLAGKLQQLFLLDAVYRAQVIELRRPALGVEACINRKAHDAHKEHRQHCQGANAVFNKAQRQPQAVHRPPLFRDNFYSIGISRFRLAFHE